MIIIMGKLQGKIIEIFFISLVALTMWEYIVGVFLEKVFKTKYWDYSDHKVNFQGRICLSNSIYWGLLGVGFINYIYPFINNIIYSIDSDVFKLIIYISAIVLVVDTIVSIIKVKNIKTTWKEVQDLNEEIKAKLKEIKESNKNKKTEKAEKKKIIDELKAKRNKIIRKLYKYVYRLKKAFPAINTKEITEILNKKVNFKRSKTKEKRREK